MKNENKFKESLLAMGEVFDKEITPSLGQIYWTSLKEFSDEDVFSAFDQAMVSSKFFPKPAEIREIICGSGEEQAHAAWGVILQCLEKGNPPPDHLHPITRQLGGWGTLKQKTYRELDFIKKDFVEIFSLQSNRGAVEHQPADVLRIR